MHQENFHRLSLYSATLQNGAGSPESLLRSFVDEWGAAKMDALGPVEKSGVVPLGGGANQTREIKHRRATLRSEGHSVFLGWVSQH